MNKKEDNFITICLVVLAAVLMFPYFAIKSLICDKSIKYYINELRDDIINLSKDED